MRSTRIVYLVNAVIQHGVRSMAQEDEDIANVRRDTKLIKPELTIL